MTMLSIKSLCISSSKAQCRRRARCIKAMSSLEDHSTTGRMTSGVSSDKPLCSMPMRSDAHEVVVSVLDRRTSGGGAWGSSTLASPLRRRCARNDDASKVARAARFGGASIATGSRCTRPVRESEELGAGAGVGGLSSPARLSLNSQLGGGTRLDDDDRGSPPTAEVAARDDRSFSAACRRSCSFLLTSISAKIRARFQLPAKASCTAKCACTRSAREE
mmetsp:Transcript_3198/g.9805  ORF Transcript_3198/g.9805 Transcript_3198/m.9805 type:complete len:219 (+) Transcript_3198:1290-1946(+)